MQKNRKSVVLALVLLPVLLLSCSSSDNQGGVQNAPAAPKNVQLSIVSQGLEVAWQPVSGATHYTVFWGSDREDYRSLANCNGPAVVLSCLKNEQLYFFVVTAWNQRGESNFSEERLLIYDDGSGRPETYVAKGNDLMNKGRYMDAYAYFSAAIRLDPGNRNAYQSRASLNEKINRHDLAEQDRAIAEKLFKEAAHYASAGQTVRPHFEKVLDRHTSFPEMLSSMKKTMQAPVEEITADLRNRIPDEELTKKYGPSDNGLKRLFDRLLKAVSTGSRHKETESDE